METVPCVRVVLSEPFPQDKKHFNIDVIEFQIVCGLKFHVDHDDPIYIIAKSITKYYFHCEI